MCVCLGEGGKEEQDFFAFILTSSEKQRAWLMRLRTTSTEEIDRSKNSNKDYLIINHLVFPLRWRLVARTMTAKIRLEVSNKELRGRKSGAQLHLHISPWTTVQLRQFPLAPHTTCKTTTFRTFFFRFPSRFSIEGWILINAMRSKKPRHFSSPICCSFFSILNLSIRSILRWLKQIRKDSVLKRSETWYDRWSPEDEKTTCLALSAP